MGRATRPRPARLAEKLQQIRLSLGLSQTQMLEQLGLADEKFQGDISKYELGRAEPSYLILLRYARLANVYVDVLLDDDLDLPHRLPCVRKHKGRVKAEMVAKKDRLSRRIAG